MLSLDQKYGKMKTKKLHDDVIKWKHFPRYWPFVRGIHLSPVNSPNKDQWRGALIFSLICTWTNGWVNNREAGDLRRHCAHYDIIVMIIVGDIYLHPCAKVMALFLNVKIFKLWRFQISWKFGPFKKKSWLAFMLNFIEIDHSGEHPSLNPETSWFFDFKLEPTMFVTRQNIQ